MDERLFNDEPVPAGPGQATDAALSRQLRRIIATIKARKKFPDVLRPDELEGERLRGLARVLVRQEYVGKLHAGLDRRDDPPQLAG